MSETATVVWCEIPVSDLEAGCAFYREVFGWEMTIIDMGPNQGANFNNSEEGVSGHLYPGAPAKDGTGPSIHLAVPDNLEAAIERCTKAGGKMFSEPITIPPGRFAYALDPDGNSIGLFERKA